MTDDEPSYCKRSPDPDDHVGAIIAHPVGGRRHWICLDCWASVMPPLDGKARLSKRDKMRSTVLEKLRPTESE